MPEFNIGNRLVGTDHPTYFIAEIGSNHDGILSKALALIEQAKEAGADCAKFQHFRAGRLVSRYGFKHLGKIGHQSGWPDDIYNVFKKYEVPWSWTPILKDKCDEVGIEFMSTPYDLESVGHLNPYVNAFKIGSGDVTYNDLFIHAASYGKPVILSSGASTGYELAELVDKTKYVPECVLQCNSDYTLVDRHGDNDYNCTKYMQLGVIKRLEYAEVVPGFSYHGKDAMMPPLAVALGAKVIEMHFKGGSYSNSPDGRFSLSTNEFEMVVNDVRDTEAAIGSGVKKVEENERDSVVVQRRCIRTNGYLEKGTIVTRNMLDYLRPAPAGSLAPYESGLVVGKKLVADMEGGQHFTKGSVY